MERKGTRSDVAMPAGAPLPAARAFVVQLRAETEPAGELFIGRAEHLASGTAERFTCAAELIEFIARVLSADDGPAQPRKETRP
jgi:hypothetical protein